VIHFMNKSYFVIKFFIWPMTRVVNFIHEHRFIHSCGLETPYKENFHWCGYISSICGQSSLCGQFHPWINSHVCDIPSSLLMLISNLILDVLSNCLFHDFDPWPPLPICKIKQLNAYSV
jgi:hypothetical protein